MAVAQPQLQIQPSTLDLAATGVHLVALDDIGHQATIEAIFGEDRAKVAPVLPYGVLVFNGSSKKLTAMAVTFRGQNAEGLRRRLIIELTSYPPDATSSAPGAISPIAPRGSLLFTPVSLVNQYLTLDTTKRKEFLPGSTGASGGARVGVSISPAPASQPSFNRG